jgi:RNA polymerase sigma-B factor
VGHPGAEDEGGRQGEVVCDPQFLEFVNHPSDRLRAELIEQNLTIASRLARKFAWRGQSFDDLYQVASLALIKAVDRFRPEYGFAFSAYASRTIVGELKRYFRDYGWSVRVPRSLQEVYLEYRDTAQVLTSERGRHPTVGEIAERMGVGEEVILEAMEAGDAFRPSSLDAPSEDGTSLIDDLGERDGSFDTSEALSVIAPMIRRLPPRERLILRLRFFEGRTQAEIADEIGVSQMQVSRLLAKILGVLRSGDADRSVA